MSEFKRIPKTSSLWCLATLAAIQLSTWGATLTNRYSFTSDASDSIGGKHGTALGGFSFAGNAVTLDGINGYIEFPANFLTQRNAVTIEAYLTVNAEGSVWRRIWDFGVPPGAGDRFFWCRVGSPTDGILATIYISGRGDLICDAATTARIALGVPVHVAWTSDPTTRKARLYLNGVLMASNNESLATATNTPALMGTTTQNWLGRSQFGADGYTAATYDEFRIWDGALNQLEIAAASQAGPNTVTTTYGTITNLVLAVANTNMIQGTVQQASCLASASGLTNKSINVRDQVGVVYSSSAANVATVNSDARITAVGSGTATITAALAGKSNSVTINVTSLPTQLGHRYSFTGNANDSVGGKHGTFQGSVTSDGTQAVLDGTTGNYIELPPYLIHATNVPQGAVTFLAWALFGANLNWARLLDFGAVVGNGGSRYIFLTPCEAGGATTRLEVSGAAFSIQNVAVPGGLSLQSNVLVACVMNPNPSRRYLGLSFNGNTVASRFDLATALGDLDNQNSWIGRSLFSADAYLNASVDEFRIYKGELSKPAIAAAYQNGPNSTNVNPGTCTNFAVNVGASTMFLEARRQASALAGFSLLTNSSLNVIGDAGCSLTSSDATVVNIDSTSGVMLALKEGVATITAIYQGFTNSKAITVILPSATLAHRYSFNETSGTTTDDSIGNADGTLNGGAGFVSGQGLLDGFNSYIELPAGTISGLGNNMTFEAWLTDNASSAWSRIFDFGSPGDFIFLVPNQGGNLLRFDTSSGGAFNAVALPDGVTNHVVLTYDYDDNYSKLYLNGTRVGTGGAPKPLSSFVDTNNWLGRSEFAVDALYNGSYDEVRLYSGLLTEAKIQANLAAGPDSVPVARPVVTALRSGNNLVLSWPTNGAAGYLAESSPVLPGTTWTNVPGVITSGANYQLTVPIGTGQQYFRLKK